MKFTYVHNCISVLDLERSVSFYEEALGLTIKRRKDAADGSFSLVFMGDETSGHEIELTWMKEMTRPYDLGDNEIHMAFAAQDMKAAHDFHEKMGCICYENPGMGIYFISDPDGYWSEIVPARK